MKQKVLSGLAMLALVMVGLLLPAPASAAGHAVVSECRTGWYVNDDEAALLPKQVEAGFAFSGPSLVHHATDQVALKDVPQVGFTATRVSGARPLFKMETTAPYSTVNVLPDGKAWSSKIAAGEVGGQDKPVTLAELGALAPYTADSRVFSFGVGYGNDTGNGALVTSITFGTTYALGCKVVTPKAPTFTAPTCDKPGSVDLPEVTGVKYTTTTAKNGATVVKAEADGEGYALAEGAKVQWARDLRPTGDCPTTEPTDEPTTPGNGGGDPTTEPTGTPSTTPTGSTPSGSSSPTSTLSPVAGAVGGGSDDGTLPKTGVKALTMFGVGGLLVAVGGITLVLMRRRRDEPGSHREDGDTQVMPAV